MTGGEIGVGGGATAGCSSGLPPWPLPSGADTAPSPPEHRLPGLPAQPSPGGLGCGGTGPGGEARRGRESSVPSSQVALRGSAAGRAAEGADGQGLHCPAPHRPALPLTAPHRPSLPRWAGAAAAGVVGAGGGRARLLLPVRCHPRTSARGRAWMPGPGRAAPVTCAGGGREDGDELSHYAAVPGAGWLSAAPGASLERGCSARSAQRGARRKMRDRRNKRSGSCRWQPRCTHRSGDSSEWGSETAALGCRQAPAAPSLQRRKCGRAVGTFQNHQND